MAIASKNGEQTILFLNRRGFSTSLLCSNCGEARDCPNCSVALTFHRTAARLSCHLCGHTAAVPKKCPACSEDALIYSGFGTEKVEANVSQIFPKAVVRRMDADSMTRKDSYRETLRAFRAGKIDMLVGTQMIAKGLHFPNVTLVGIINADLALHLPDFRAGERTFQLLTQVAGRAGRGEQPGEVFVQTYTPFSPSIQFARHHDFAGYFEQELEFRERCDFPPFKHAVLITIRSEHEARAKFSAETLARRLKEALPDEFTLGSPAPAPLEKLQGHFRFHILIRGAAITRLSRMIREVLDKLPFPEDVTVGVDVDPVPAAMSSSPDIDPAVAVPEDMTGRPRRVVSGRVSLRNTFSALRHRNFRLFFSGQPISLTGTWMTTTAQGWLVYQLTGSKALLGVVAAAGSAPMLIFSTWAAGRLIAIRNVPCSSPHKLLP